MARVLLIIIVAIFFSFSFISAHGEEDFAKAEEIIKNKVSCEELSSDQLEILGDYYMEQMHPGEAHKTMDEMMGGEGSESLRQVHINMGNSFYCGEHESMTSGMMGGSGGMMGSGMMNMMNGNNFGNSASMFGKKYSNSLVVFNWIFSILILVALVLLIVWLLKQIQNTKTKKKRN